MAKYLVQCAGKSCLLKNDCSRYSEKDQTLFKDPLGSPWFVDANGSHCCLEFIAKDAI